MSHPTPTGNGCSLEDCYTNLFALTDLCGIKWRKLSAENLCTVDPLDDPVLQSFTRCIQADILCVWRRVQRSTDQLTSRKELWIFWYGDEPANIESLLAKELSETDNGCWEQGLTYECRSLLFKALHNLIERCLLSKGFVRSGKWFVQPFEHGPVSLDKSSHLSISFSFFLHGESTVCASIDVRQHPPLWRLNSAHLAAMGHCGTQTGLQVLLAPYGLAGYLTGQTYKDSDVTTHKLLEDWRQFYYMEDVEGRENVDSKLPPAVEVIVAGARMRYPSSFVLVPAESEQELANRIGMGPGLMSSLPPSQPPSMAPTPRSGGTSSAVPLTPPTSPCGAPLNIDLIGHKGGATTLGSGDCSQEHASGVKSGAISQRIMQKVWQDGCQCAATPRHAGDSSSEEAVAAAVGSWDFVDPAQRNQCSCSKSKAGKRMSNLNQKQGLPNNNRHMKGQDKTDRSSSRKFMTPFHRRSPVGEDVLQTDLDAMVTRPMTSHPLPSGLIKDSSGAGGGMGLPHLRGNNTATLR